MPSVWIPALLRPLTGGQETVRVTGTTVGEVIAALDALHPGVEARLCDGGELRRGMAVAVDGQVGRQGLATPVGAESEVHFLPAISGG